jgi:HlyD family secretion protein
VDSATRSSNNLPLDGGRSFSGLLESAEGNMKKIIILAILVGILGGGGGYAFYRSQQGPKTTFRFDEVKRGPLVATIGSTGTLQPRELVDIGAQVLGPIIFIGKDANTQSGIVDWGSVVEGPVLDTQGKVIKKGTVLAQIDPALYEAAVQSAEASVKSAEAAVHSADAAVQSAKADLRQKQATLVQATLDWGRAKKLYPTGGVAKAEYDQYEATYGVATANVGVSEANIKQQEANVRNAQAAVNTALGNLRTAQVNLDYTTIASPVTGIVIDRRVNVGQTVVASLSAPSLFLIAKDLSKMEVWATVNEVDVGKIKVGQDVTFTVDAYPGRIYKGKVVPQGKLSKRLNATMNQNVVTYTVVVSVDNTDGALDPYLTTNLTFIVEDKPDVLLVPNAAVRWQPSSKHVAPEVRDAYAKIKGKKRSPTDTDQDHGFVWVPTDDGHVRYIEIRTGSSDGIHSEVVEVLGGGELPDKVVVGEGKGEAQGGGANPFIATPFGPKKKD